MAFLTPLFLFALAAVAIPIAIHLWQTRRPKTVAFSTLAFFEQLKLSVMRRIRLKRWILLALRTLAVVCLALALARPLLRPGTWGAEGGGPVLRVVLVDNGPAMGRLDRNGPYIDQAKAALAGLVERAGAGDRFLIVPTHGPLPATGPLSPEAARAVAARLEVHASGDRAARRIPELRVRALAEPGLRSETWWITDGRAARTEALAAVWAAAPAPGGLSLVRIGEQQESNLAVDTVRVREAAGPGRPLVLEAVVRNTGLAPVTDGFVSLEESGRLTAQQAVRLDTGAAVTLRFDAVPTTTDWAGVLVLEGDGYAADNRHPVAFGLPAVRQVRVVGGDAAAGEPLTRVREAAAAVSATLEWGAEPDAADVWVLNGVPRIDDGLRERLVRAVRQGKGVVLFPPATPDADSYVRLFGALGMAPWGGRVGTYGAAQPAAGVDRVSTGHFLLDGVFDADPGAEIRTPLPDLAAYHPLPDPTAEPVLRATDGSVIVAFRRVGEGRVVVAGFGLDGGWSTFPAQPLFAPLVYRMIWTAADAGAVERRTIRLGDPLDLPLRIRAATGTIVREGTVWPTEVRRTNAGIRLSADTEDWTPGLYTFETGDRSIPIAVGHAIPEHDLRTLTEERLTERLGASAAAAGREIQLGLVLAGFLLLLLETAVARYFTEWTSSSS